MELNDDISMGDASATNLVNGADEQATAQDPTDLLPPPQPVVPQVGTTEHLSTIQSAVAMNTPPSTTPAPRTSSVPPTQSNTTRPDKPALHGGPTRQYLNQNVTPHLLEGMKYLAMNEPEKPLAWLADFLREKSKQIEG